MSRKKYSGEDEQIASLVGVVRAVEAEVARGVYRDGAHRILAIGPAWRAVDEAQRRAEARRLGARIHGGPE